VPVLFAQPIEQYPAHLAFAGLPTMTNVDAAYPASRLVHYDPTSVTRSTATSAVITWDFGSNREFDVVSLLYTNTSYAATLVIEGSLNGTAWTTLRASAPLWAHRTTVPGSWTGESNDPRRGALPRNSSFYLSATVLTYRYIRLTVSDPQTTNMTFGRLFVGRSFQPGTGIQYGSSFSFEGTARAERTDRGALILDAGTSRVNASLKLDFLTKTEMYDFVYEFDFWRGAGREMLACLDTSDVPNLQKNLLYCTISEGRTITFDAFNVHSKTWSLESIA
jgi:hypothetical protein